jgi:hypothetical protein
MYCTIIRFHNTNNLLTFMRKNAMFETYHTIEQLTGGVL